jgi:hypothetical protein
LKFWKRLCLIALAVGITALWLNDGSPRDAVQMIDNGFVAADYHPPLVRKDILKNSKVRGGGYRAIVPSLIDQDYRFDRKIRDAVSH